MSTREKVLIGGVGGLTPLFMNFLIIDGRVLAEGLTTFVLLGYSVKVAALFILGAFWVWIHEIEDKKAVFQLGMIAPALITAYLNANNVQVPSQPPPTSEIPSPIDPPSVSKAGGFLSSAYAQEAKVGQASNQPPKEITGKDGAPMVLIPEGEFTMGSEFGDVDERPVHRVYLDAFYLDKYEVTTSRFAKFMSEGGGTAESGVSQFLRGFLGKLKAKIRKPAYWNQVKAEHHDRPVGGVTWGNAEGYCEWAGKRLPTSAEWEKAARGTDGRTYPWGDEAPTSKRANYGKEFTKNFYSEGLQPVGSYEEGKSPYGVYDMAGNVWEWVADWYAKDYYQTRPGPNPKGPADSKYKVIRGGSWVDDAVFLRPSNRFWLNPSVRNFDIGFRCAQLAP